MADVLANSYKTFFKITFGPIDGVLEVTVAGVQQVIYLSTAAFNDAGYTQDIFTWLFPGFVTNIVVTKQKTGDLTGYALIEGTCQDLTFVKSLDIFGDFTGSLFKDAVLANEPP